MSDYFERVERQLVERVERSTPGRSRSARLSNLPGYLAMAAAVMVVLVVPGAFLLARGGAPNQPPAGHGDVSLVLSASPAHPTSPVLDRTVQILRKRLRAAFPGAEVTRAGEQIVVDVRNAPAGARSQILALTAPGRLAIYDWEGNTIAPNGKTVASQLEAGNPAALRISQGNGSAAPGEPGAGALSIHQALALVPKATVGGRFALVQAVDLNPGHPTPSGAPNAKFYVLRGPPALSGTDLTKPLAGTDPNSRAPIVTFDFTSSGLRAFRALTAKLARRGALVSRLDQARNQHFAIALDNQLIQVPFVDYKQFPDGIKGIRGADVVGNLTARSAQDLAILLRFGPLPADFRAAG